MAARGAREGLWSVVRVKRGACPNYEPRAYARPRLSGFTRANRVNFCKAARAALPCAHGHWPVACSIFAAPSEKRE